MDVRGGRTRTPVARSRVILVARAIVAPASADARAGSPRPLERMFRCPEKLARALGKMPEAGAKSVDARGRFRAPELSARAIAALRAAALASGHPWPFDRKPGTQKTVERAGKGHKWERERGALEAKRREALAKQPELVAGYRARQRSKAKGLDKVWDDFILTKSERTLKLRTEEQGGKK